MGQARAKREKFFQEHPACCFCGGSHPTETIDHLPPRSLFTARTWPEGYEFPACKECNGRTRDIEQVLALYARLGIGDNSGQFASLVRGVRNNWPDLLPDPRVSANQKKRFLSRVNLRLPVGQTTDDLYLARVPEKLSEILAPFFAKLFCALYYFENHRIFPIDGALTTFFTTSEYARNNQELASVFGMLSGGRETRRANRDISKEFAYRFESGESGKVFAVLAHLHQRLFIFAGGVTDRNFEMDADEPKWRDVFGALVK